MTTAAPEGALYVVATPIGNLGDMSPRAVEVLRMVQLIAAEDTRRSRPLLTHFDIRTPLIALHEHNEARVADKLLKRLEAGESVALISDAGTPLISDPGFHLVRSARERSIRVVPIPGPNAAICALSVAGLPSDRFVFEGFLPSRAAARRTRLDSLKDESRTLIFYESSHRILKTLSDMCHCFGNERHAVVARELTKRFETVLSAPLAELLTGVETDPDQQKGEFVILVAGAEAGDRDLLSGHERLIRLLLEEMSPARAARLAAKITGERKNRLYELAQRLSGETGGEPPS
ncbi:MAG: 16S rRNA (cytidine(1402)-2'-O)-methyltransferase [Gammaproteobacteria bacterium]